VPPRVLESFEAGLSPLLQAAAAVEAHLSAHLPEPLNCDPAEDAATAAAAAAAAELPAAAAGVLSQLSSPTAGGLPADVGALQQALAVTKARLADERAKAADLQDSLSAKEVRGQGLGRRGAVVCPGAGPLSACVCAC
jgi:hypothetical protein